MKNRFSIFALSIAVLSLSACGKQSQMNVPSSDKLNLKKEWSADTFKLLKYKNATSLVVIEYKVAQYDYLEDCWPDEDYYNSLNDGWTYYCN